jgi:hypothetical protein
MDKFFIMSHKHTSLQQKNRKESFLQSWRLFVLAEFGYLSFASPLSLHIFAESWPTLFISFRRSLVGAMTIAQTTILQMVFSLLCQNILSWEGMLRHQQNWRIRDPPKLIDSLFVLMICIDKYTQVFDFTNGHLLPTPWPVLTNAPSLTPLICYSLSLSPSLSSDSPLCFHLCKFR